MGTDTLHGNTEAHITTEQWRRMERMISELHDALLGTMDRPGGVLVRIEHLEHEVNVLKSANTDRSAGWRQAGWIVVSVVLSTLTGWLMSGIVNHPH